MRNNIFKLLEHKKQSEVPKKRYARKPDTAFLKSQQKKGFAEMQRFVDYAKESMFCLEGFAGTGKSTLISTFVENYLATTRTQKVAMTAPTNKAVKVLYKFAEYTHTNLSYGTIHSLLGLKEKINDDGEITFEKDFGAEAKIDEIDLLVVDEVSMFQDSLFDMVYEQTHRGLKVIFIGDSAQIPPIGKEDCIPLNEEARREYGILHFKLTEILRQAEDNPIIKLSMIIRENPLLRNPLREHRIDKVDAAGKGTIFLSPTNKKDDDFFYDVLYRFYTSENFKEDVDFVKSIAYKNATVDFLNKEIRQMIYKEERLPKILQGEKLIANKPIIWGDDILFSNNEELEVISFEDAIEDINEGQYVLKYYDTVVVSKSSSFDEPEPKNIKIIHEDSEQDYKDILNSLFKLARQQPKGSLFSKKYWESYWEFKNYFADVKYSYAVTAHKSQGSTYNVAIVLEGNIDKNWNIQERNKIKYTAVTRPKDLLVIIK